MTNWKLMASLLFILVILFETITVAQTNGNSGRDKNLMRVDWKDASKTYATYKGEVDKSLDILDRETHGFFHGDFDTNFSQLTPEKKEQLIKKFNLLLDEKGLRTTATFADVFQIPPGTDLLFPLHFGQDEPYSSSVLEGLTLRSKKGQEKGKITAYRLEVFGDFRKHFYTVATVTGESKDERVGTGDSHWGRTGSDDMTVLWSEISQRTLISIRSVAQRKSRGHVGIGRSGSAALPGTSTTNDSSVTDDTVIVKLGDSHTFRLDDVSIAVQLVGKASGDYLWNKYELNVEIQNASHNLVTFDSSKTYLVDDQGSVLRSNAQDLAVYMERMGNDRSKKQTDCSRVWTSFWVGGPVLNYGARGAL